MNVIEMAIQIVGKSVQVLFVVKVVLVVWTNNSRRKDWFGAEGFGFTYMTQTGNNCSRWLGSVLFLGLLVHRN